MDNSKDEIVRQDILKGAQKLFQQFGLKKTTMDEIAAACGKAKSTLYHYFKSKEEVFDAVISIELKNLRILVKNKVEEKRNAQERLITYFITFHQEVINKFNLYRIIKQELLSEAIAQTHLKNLMDFEKSYITRLLEDGHDIGELKSFEKKEIAWLAELLVAAFIGIVRYSIETDDGLDQDKLEMASKILIPRIFS